MEATKEKRATTPGPWYAYQSRKDVHRNIVSHYGSMIAREVYHTNARLIAAAPAMYEVLQELAESMELAKNYGYEKEHAMIQEILAKVEGGEG